MRRQEPGGRLKYSWAWLVPAIEVAATPARPPFGGFKRGIVDGGGNRRLKSPQLLRNLPSEVSRGGKSTGVDRADIGAVSTAVIARKGEAK
jgi:hypothetical protein